MSLHQPAAGGFEARVVADPAELAALKGAWHNLWQKSRSATLFQAPDWLICWWDIFEPGALCVIAVRDGEKLIGLAPLYREGTKLLPLGHGVCGYQDILLDPDAAGAARAGIAEVLGGITGITTLEFDALAPDAAALGLSVPGWREDMASGTVCPFLPLPADTGALARALPAPRLHHLKTVRRRLMRKGEPAILEGDIDNAGALFGELLRLSALQQGSDGTARIAGPRMEGFHMAALPGLIAEGLVRLYALAIDETIAGVYYGFQYRNTAYVYQWAEDPALSFESPGTVLISHAIEAAVSQGAARFDFLSGGEAYKYEWGAQDRFTLRFRLSRDGG